MEANVLTAQRDVRLVMERAKIVLRILDNEEVEIVRNHRYSLNVIAITGMDYDGEVLLEEIGLFRTKPFRVSRIGRIGRKKSDPKGRTFCSSRSRAVRLTEDQYCLVAPIVFQLLQELVDERVSGWKRGSKDPVFIWSPNCWFSRSSKKFFDSWKPRYWPRGLRFSVMRDSFFAQDTCWAELNTNIIVRQYLKGLASFIGLCLNDVQKKWREEKKFKDLEVVKKIVKVLESKSLSRHLLIEMLMSYLPTWIWKGSLIWTEMAEIIGWQEGDADELRIAAEALPDPRMRLEDMQIRIVNNKSSECAKKYIFFEVFPRA